MYNPGNLENNGANQDDVQKRNSENFIGHNMSLTSNNANSPQSDSASKTSTTAALRRWRRPEAQDNSSKNVSTRGSSSESENSVKPTTPTVNQNKEMNPLHNNSNSYANNTHTDNLNGSASQNDYSMFVSPASLSPIVPQSTARPYDTSVYVPRVPPETGAYSRTSPIVTTPNKLNPEVKSSDTTVRHPVSGNNQSPYYHSDNSAQQHYRSATGYPIQNTPPLAPTSAQSPIYGVPNQKRDYGYQNYTAKSPQDQRTTREHSVLTHCYSAANGIHVDSARVQGIGDDPKINGFRPDSRVISQGYQMQNTAERRVTPPKPKSPTYRNFPNSSTMMDSRILAQNYLTSAGRVQAAEYMAQNYYLNKSSCIVQEARVQNQMHSTENPILDSRYQQSYNNYIMPKTTVINSQDPKLYRNIITSSKKHAAPFPILEQRLNTAENYSPEYLAQNNPQSKYGQVIMPRSSPTSRVIRDGSNVPMHSNYIPQSSNQKCPQDMMIPSNYALHNKYFQQNTNQDWRLVKEYETNAHLNQMNQMHTRLPHSTNRTPEVPRDISYVEQNQRIIQKSRMFYPEPGSVEYLQYAAKPNISVAQKSPKVISYNVSDQRMPDQNDYLNLTRTSNTVRPNEYSRNPVIQTPNAPEGPYIVHQPYRSDVANDQHNYQMLQNSRHPSYAINYSNRQVKEIPPRNISPRRTFQENMPYFVISPPHAGLSTTSPPSLYNSEHPQHNYPGYYSRDPNYPGVGAKSMIPQYPVDPTKYQNVPFSRNLSQSRHPYGYQEQYFQPNQFPGNMYRQHNPAMSDQTAQARAYAEEYRNDDSMNSNYSEFERNRRKEEIGKSLKEFLESWEDDEDIVANLPDLVLNIPTDRQKNNSVSSSESSENNEVDKSMPTKEIPKDIQGNSQVEPLYVLDARSISSDALSQYLPYCKVYQSLPENIRGFYPNSVPSEDASVASQPVASETSETQPENEDLETNIIDSPSPHDLSVNRISDKEDNIQAEVLNLSTNRNKENDEFMTEEYSNASDDTSLLENVSSPAMNEHIYAKEDVNKKCEVIKSPGDLQNKTKEEDIEKTAKSSKISKDDLSTEISKTKDKQKISSVENEDKQDSLVETTIEKPVTASVIVQNTFVPNKSDNSSGKPKEILSEKLNLDKSIEESNPEITKNDEKNSSPKSKDLEKKRPSVDSMESADSIRTSLIESEIKNIDFNKDNLDDDQFDFDTALLSTETKDSNEDISQDSKTNEDSNKNCLIRDNEIDLSLETMLLSPGPMDTSFENCIPEVEASSSENDDTCNSVSNTKETKEFDESSIENVAEETKSNQITTANASIDMSVDKPELLENSDVEVTGDDERKNIKELNNSENNEKPFINIGEHSDNLEKEKIGDKLCLNTKLDSVSSETNLETKTIKSLLLSDVEVNKKSENDIEQQFTSEEDNFDCVDDSKIEITEKELDLSTMDDENSVFESQFENNKSSFTMAEILKPTHNFKKCHEENIKIKNSAAVDMKEENLKLDDLNLSETIKQDNVTAPVNKENINNEIESNLIISNEKSSADIEDVTKITNDIDKSFEENEKVNTSTLEDNINILIENSQKSLEDVELLETKTSIPSEQIENHENSIIEIEIPVENDIQVDVIECAKINQDNLQTIDDSITNSENQILEVDKNEAKQILELSKLETEGLENLIEIPSREIINCEKLDTIDTNEISNNIEKVEVTAIIEENITSENEQTQNVSHINFNEPNVSLSPSVLIQEEKTVIEEFKDESAEINDEESIAENKSDIDSISNKTDEDISINDETDTGHKTPDIKIDTNLLDEDTMCGFEDLSQDNNKSINIIEVKLEDTEKADKEFDIKTSSNTCDLSHDNLKVDDETMDTVINHASSDTDEYQHLIKLEDEETLDNTDIENYNTPINGDKSFTLVEEEKSVAPVEEEKSVVLVKEEKDIVSLSEEKEFVPEDEEKHFVPDDEEKHFVPDDEEKHFVPDDEEKDIAPVNEEKDNTPIDFTAMENNFLADSKETSIDNNIDPLISKSLSIEEENYISETSRKEIQEEVPIIQCSIPEDDTINEKELNIKEAETTVSLDDKTTKNVDVLFNEEIFVEHESADENITIIENNTSEIPDKVEENFIVPEDSSCVVVFSDDENIVILQSNTNELVNPEIAIEETTYITTEETNSEEININPEIVLVDIEKDEFITEKIIEEEIICEKDEFITEKIVEEEIIGEKDEFITEKIIEEELIGDEVIIYENGINDDWIQNEEIVETKIEDQDRKENERSKIEELEKKRLLMEKRRQKKKRSEKLRKRKLFSAIKATNKFLEEERKTYAISETLINENSKSNSPFKEKITEQKELFINPENPSSSSEDNSSMTHELLNLKPRIKRRFNSVDSSSPKIDFVAPKRRYSNMEYVRNHFKKPIINLDEISNNITKVIENMNKQENLQYLENSTCTKTKNIISEVSKIMAHKNILIENEPKTNCLVLKNEERKHFGKFEIKNVIDIEEIFVKPVEMSMNSFVKPIINLNNVTEDKSLLSQDKVEEENPIEKISVLDEVMKPNEFDAKNKSESTKLIKLNNDKLEIIDNKEKSVDTVQFERNILDSIKPALNEIKSTDTIVDSNYKELPSFQNYTDDLRKKIKADITNKPAVVLKPLTVSKISSLKDSDIEIEIITKPLQNKLILPNKQRNLDPRIDRPKETPNPDVSSCLIKNKTPKTFGLTEYTKHYLKMKTGQSIDSQIHFGQNGVKRLDPRLTVKPAKSTETVDTVILSKENTKQIIDTYNKSKNSQEKKVKINLQDYRNRKLSLSESDKQSINSNEQLDVPLNMSEEKTDSEDFPGKFDSTSGLTNNTEPCRFYIRDKSAKPTDLLSNKTVEKIVIKPKKILEKISNDTFGVSKDNINKQSVTTINSTNNHDSDYNNLSYNNINKSLKSNIDFKIQKPKKRKKRFRNLDASDEEDEVVTKQQNATLENQNEIVEDASLKLNEDSQQSSTISKHSGNGDSNCSCCVDLNSNGGTTTNNCGLKCHIKLNSLDNKIRNYEINKNTSGISNLKLTLKPVKKKPKPAFAEVLSSIDSAVESEVKTTIKRKPLKPGLNKCDSSKKSTMWTIKNKVPKVIIKRNAGGYCAVFRDVSSNPIWQPKIRLKRQKYIESLVLSNQVKISKKIPS